MTPFTLDSRRRGTGDYNTKEYSADLAPGNILLTLNHPEFWEAFEVSPEDVQEKVYDILSDRLFWCNDDSVIKSALPKLWAQLEFCKGEKKAIEHFPTPKTLTEAIEQVANINATTEGPLDKFIAYTVIQDFIAQKFTASMLRAGLDKDAGSVDTEKALDALYIELIRKE